MAIPSKIALELVTPDRALVREDVDEIQVPGTEGYFGILPGHTPLLATMKVGELWYRVGNERFYLAVSGGFVEVLPDRVTVLAQVAERAEEIDVPRAEAARQRAEARVAVESELGDKPFLLEQGFTLADVMIGSPFLWKRRFGGPPESPKLEQYMDRLIARPGAAALRG